MRLLVWLLLVPLTVSAADFFQPWWDGPAATGEWWGVRPAAENKGITVNGTYYLEVWGNPVGGMSQTGVYDGILWFGAEVDLEKLIGWRGATFQTSWFWFSGDDISAEAVGNMLTISSLVGPPGFRNYELSLEQDLWDGTVSIKAGQFGADTEFALSATASLFLNATFDWGPFLYMNIPNGGPAWPMTAPGVRLLWQPQPEVSYRGAIFQGNVFSPTTNRAGFYWRLDAQQGFFSMHELAVQWPSAPLPGAAKLGAWFQTGQSADPLATSTSSPNVGFYVFLDQALFREPGSRGGANEPPQGLSSFARVAFGPPDRNWVSFYADGGLTYTGLIPTRDADQLGVAFACAQVSSGARSHIASTGLTPAPAEMAAEFTYAIQVNPWLAIQPDLQFIIWPGASRSIPNALVIGCRTTLTF